MAVIEYDSYKQKLLAMSDTFENLQKALDIESSKHEIARLEAEAHEDGFWNDIERSQANQMRTKQLQNKVHRFEKLVSTRDDLLALIDMGNEMDDASLLPELEEGMVADLGELGADQHFTQPPPRYTEASLVRALEEKGIGRPSTYAPTISTIINRGYVSR